jgi:hypothetical protein
MSAVIDLKLCIHMVQVTQDQHNVITPSISTLGNIYSDGEGFDVDFDTVVLQQKHEIKQQGESELRLTYRRTLSYHSAFLTHLSIFCPFSFESPL